VVANPVAFRATRHSSAADSLLTVALTMAAVGVPILAVIMWFFFRPYRPRRLATAADLDRFLPR
jgi:hypothetical protein